MSVDEHAAAAHDGLRLRRMRGAPPLSVLHPRRAQLSTPVNATVNATAILYLYLFDMFVATCGHTSMAEPCGAPA